VAPEILRELPYNEKCDVFSYAVVLWELYTRHIPWHKVGAFRVANDVAYQGARYHPLSLSRLFQWLRFTSLASLIVSRCCVVCVCGGACACACAAVVSCVVLCAQIAAATRLSAKAGSVDRVLLGRQPRRTTPTPCCSFDCPTLPLFALFLDAHLLCLSLSLCASSPPPPGASVVR
jgi:hypothetical protein